MNFRVVLKSFSSLFHNKTTFVDFYACLLLFKIIKEGLNLNCTNHHTDFIVLHKPDPHLKLEVSLSTGVIITAFDQFHFVIRQVVVGDGTLHVTLNCVLHTPKMSVFLFTSFSLPLTKLKTVTKLKTAIHGHHPSKT